MKERDQWPETNPGDDNVTSVRTGREVLFDAGHVLWAESYAADDHIKRSGYQADLQQGP